MFDDVIGCPWYISTIWHIPQYSRYSVPAGETLAGESTGQDPPPSASSPTSTWPTSPAQDPTLWVNIIWYLAKKYKKITDNISLIYKRKRCQCNWANRQISWGMANHLVILQQHKMYQRWKLEGFLWTSKWLLLCNLSCGILRDFWCCNISRCKSYCICAEKPKTPRMPMMH